MTEDFVLAPEALDKYVLDRFFSEKVQPKDVTLIKQINGITPAELQTWILDPSQLLTSDSITDLIEIHPRESHEIHVYYPKTRTLFVANAKGDMRRRRTADAVTEWLRRTVRHTEVYHDVSIQFIDEERDPKNPSKTNRFYNDNGAAIVERVVDAVHGQKNLARVGTIMFGPLYRLNAQWENVYQEKTEVPNDYMPFQIVTIQGKTVICFDYVFGDQVERVMRVLTEELKTAARLTNQELHVNIIGFGKYGGLDEQMQREDVFIPTSAIEEVHLSSRDITRFPYRNRLAEKGVYSILERNAREAGVAIFKGTTLNAGSVVKQTESMLKQARQYGAQGIDMESRYIAGWLDLATYHGPLLTFEYYLAGYVSDNPLQRKRDGNRDTIHQPLTEYRGERTILAAIEEIIVDKKSLCS